MPDRAPEGVERALGRIFGKLEGIDHRLESAEQSRKEMYGRFDKHNSEVVQLRNEIGDLSRRVGAVEDQMKKSLVVVERVEGYERNSKQAWSIVSGAGSRLGRALMWGLRLAGVAAIAFWREIVEFLTGR